MHVIGEKSRWPREGVVISGLGHPLGGAWVPPGGYPEVPAVPAHTRPRPGSLVIFTRPRDL